MTSRTISKWLRRGLRRLIIWTHWSMHRIRGRQKSSKLWETKINSWRLMFKTCKVKKMSCKQILIPQPNILKIWRLKFKGPLKYLRTSFRFWDREMMTLREKISPNLKSLSNQFTKIMKEIMSINFTRVMQLIWLWPNSWTTIKTKNYFKSGSLEKTRVFTHLEPRRSSLNCLTLVSKLELEEVISTSRSSLSNSLS